MQKQNIFKSYKLHLNNDKLMRQKWYIISGITAVLVIFFAIILGIMERFINLSGNLYPAVNNAKHLNEAMRIMAIIYFAIFFLPYLYFIAAFFSGINQIYRSFTLHMIIWATILVGILLMFITCVMLIVGYSNLDSYNLIRNFQ